jgi:hypothetical protein
MGTNAFVVVTTFLFIVHIVSSKHRPIIAKVVVISNCFLIVLSLGFILLAVNDILGYSEDNEFEQYARTNRMFGPFWYAYFGPILLKGILPQVLWIKRLRHSAWTSQFICPFLLIDFYMPTIVSLHRNFFPATLNAQLNYACFALAISIYCALLGLIYFVTKKKNSAV